MARSVQSSSLETLFLFPKFDAINLCDPLTETVVDSGTVYDPTIDDTWSIFNYVRNRDGEDEGGLKVRKFCSFNSLKTVNVEIVPGRNLKYWSDIPTVPNLYCTCKTYGLGLLLMLYNLLSFQIY